MDSAYQFQNGDYFDASMTLQLTGSPITPRKEAGFLFSTANAGDIQFIVNTDGREVVHFGGISFYSFNSGYSMTYNSGDLITLGLNYFLDTSTGNNALQFFANGNASPVFDFAPGAGIGNGSTLGGYFQIVNDPANPGNSGSAVFQNITITVPEPSSLVLLSAGVCHYCCAAAASDIPPRRTAGSLFCRAVSGLRLHKNRCDSAF